MVKLWRKSALLTIFFVLVCQLSVLAAPLATAPTELNEIRFHSSADKDRIVLDVGRVTKYYVTVDEDGTKLSLDVENINDRIKRKPPISSELIEKVTYSQVKTRFKMTITLKKQVDYNVITLQGPARIVLDIMPKNFLRRAASQPAPGLWQTKLERRDERGLVTAYFLEIDPRLYTIRPELANGIVSGRQTLSGISDEVQAVAAINANYFFKDGAIIGVLAMDGKVVGSTWYKRSALCLRPNGSAFIRQVYYDGSVTARGITLGVSGINCERTADSLVIYNSAFGATTGTNEFGMEYTVQNGKIMAVKTGGNSAIPPNGYVISVHGKAKTALARLRKGDTVERREETGVNLAEAPLVIGAGPTLLRQGRICNTVVEEQFPADIAKGRAPRTGVGLMLNGHYLFAVVDGRQKHSDGCTLDEFARLLLEEGATEAINFDGGGSSEIIVGGKILNKPSDGKERPIGSALVVYRK